MTGLVRVLRADGTLHTVAGNGASAHPTPNYDFGVPATTVSLMDPTRVAIDNAAGAFFVSDTTCNCVRRVDAAGIITLTAGDLSVASGGFVGSFSGDGGPASTAGLNGPLGVAWHAPTSRLLIVDHGNARVRVVGPDGTISTLAGGGVTYPSWGAAPATSIYLFEPTFVAVDDADASVYVTLDKWATIAKVTADGALALYAGMPCGRSDGYCGFAGDGGPASSATFNTPNGLALDAAGNLYVADTGNARVRVVAPSNASNPATVYTLAGDGEQAFAGDGGPATAASMWAPMDVAVSADGARVLIGGYGDGTVRRVSVGQMSRSPRPSASPTRASVTRTPSRLSLTPTHSRTASRPPRGAHSASASVAATHSAAATRSGTASASATRSDTKSPTPSGTGTHSPSATRSETPSPSATRTDTRSPAATRSPTRTGSATATPSRAPTATATMTKTSVGTRSPTRSTLPSSTRPHTPSRTPSATRKHK